MAKQPRKANLPDLILDALDSSERVGRLLARLDDDREISITGLTGSLKGILLAHLFRSRSRQLIAVAPDGGTALDIWNDASIVLGEERVLFIGERHPRKHLSIQTLDSTFAENADVLRALHEEPVRLVVTDAETMLLSFPSLAEIREHSLRLEQYSMLRQEDLVKRLAYGGFERKEFVESSGDYALRGGIIDIFPIGFDNPVRVEFFGDEVDSIREFDSMSQRSIRRLESVGLVTTLFPEEGGQVQGTIFDYFLPDTLLFIDEPAAIERASDSAVGERWPEIRRSVSGYQRIVHSVIPHADKGTISADPVSREIIDIRAHSQPSFNSAIRLLKDNLIELESRNFSIHLCADTEHQVRRLEVLMNEAEDDAESPRTFSHPIHLCTFSHGFVLPDSRLAVYTEHEIFNRVPVRRKARKGFKGITLRDARLLNPGDFVVHVDKGIGKFAGFRTISVRGGRQETAKIIYADDDILYVNLNYIHRLQKYSSREGHAPSLTKLGSAEWERAKARTKRRLKEIARDLIRLYARRKMARGFAFSPDSHWQREMEASFLYEDTPDQARATEEVKNDMLRDVPMDRLICGDVGYGKTEVALRASFKAVYDGKQVAVLVPTTILAQQHFNTFQDRLHRYSVNVEVLSRFRTSAVQKEIIAKLRDGGVDILIGTHRMLSRDIAFRDLGLLIIDEEHRFGVAAKEKLRTLREQVDTLTLSATPIPRTLNFSLLGARDLSIIETPPRNRLPIITDIVPFHDAIIQEGMEREMARGGQAYFVHHRVNDIEVIAERVRAMVPGMRVAVAHGQMKSSDLERVMMRFMERKYDLLVCTKIIESGLDIPNVNTIFINRADAFGLAELYQLRGRVGRSNIQAYAYLMIQKSTRLSRSALKRLQAIEEFAELGTGFQLAMRDLEIRGAGNFLGAEQSGFISEIGFELYVKTLEEAVAELKAEEFSDLFTGQPSKPRTAETVMELGIDAYFPEEFMRDATERFAYYKRLYELDDEDEIGLIAEELRDRFGALPSEAESLLIVARLRLMASRLHLSRVTWEKGLLTLVLPPDDDEEFYATMFQPIVDHIMGRRERHLLEQSPNTGGAPQLRLLVKDVGAVEEVENTLHRLLELFPNVDTQENGTKTERHAGKD